MPILPLYQSKRTNSQSMSNQCNDCVTHTSIEDFNWQILHTINLQIAPITTNYTSTYLRFSSPGLLLNCEVTRGNCQPDPQTSDNAPFWELPVHTSDVTNFNLGITPSSYQSDSLWPWSQMWILSKKASLCGRARLLSGNYLLSQQLFAHKPSQSNPPPQKQLRTLRLCRPHTLEDRAASTCVHRHITAAEDCRQTTLTDWTSGIALKTQHKHTEMGYKENKLASLEASLFQNYVPPSYRVTDVGAVQSYKAQINLPLFATLHTTDTCDPTSHKQVVLLIHPYWHWVSQVGKPTHVYLWTKIRC